MKRFNKEMNSCLSIDMEPTVCVLLLEAEINNVRIVSGSDSSNPLTIAYCGWFRVESKWTAKLSCRVHLDIAYSATCNMWPSSTHSTSPQCWWCRVRRYSGAYSDNKSMVRRNSLAILLHAWIIDNECSCLLNSHSAVAKSTTFFQ